MRPVKLAYRVGADSCFTRMTFRTRKGTWRRLATQAFSNQAPPSHAHTHTARGRTKNRIDHCTTPVSIGFPPQTLSLELSDTQKAGVKTGPSRLPFRPFFTLRFDNTADPVFCMGGPFELCWRDPTSMTCVSRVLWPNGFTCGLGWWKRDSLLAAIWETLRSVLITVTEE